MIKELIPIIDGMLALIAEWEPKLSGLPIDMITERRNSQNRTIKQIVGHMVDSASNNTHRIVHLQYQPSPLIYPDYANLGNNDRWIAIQSQTPPAKPGACLYEPLKAVKNQEPPEGGYSSPSSLNRFI